MIVCYYCGSQGTSATLYRYSLDGRLLRTYNVCKECVNKGANSEA